MESGIIELSLLSRSLGPACSNVEFLFLGQRRRIYRAYGVPGGAILIQRLPVTKRDLSKESAITEIVIDGVRSTTTSRIDDILRIAHNHGETCIMAATSQTDLSIISLLPFHEATSIDPKQNPVYKRLLSIPFPGVVAMEWTRNGEGLVLSDAKGYVTCLGITVHHKPPPTETLTRRSLLYDMTGSIEILWVEEMKSPCEILCPGDTIESPCATAASSLSLSVDLFTPAAPEMERQTLMLAAPLTGMAWSRVRTPPAASMKPCLLTVESNGVLRIWAESPKPISSYLGCSRLQSTSDPVQAATAYHVELVIEPQDPDLVPHSMQACWADAFPESEEDPRLAWIIATYQAKRTGGIEECCAVYVVHGLPVELQGTQITCSYATTFLHSSCAFESRCLPATTLRAVLLRFEPTPLILMAESGRLQNRIETRTALLCVDTLPPDSLHLHLESTSIHEILGFASVVQQLVAHPVHDCVCVLTADRMVSIWDLWPVRKLADIQADDFGIGHGVYALTWMDLGHHYGELGHVLLLGDEGAVVCLLMADHHNGKPVVSIDVLASHTYPQRLYPVSLISLPCPSSPGGHKMTYLIRARSADIEIDDDDEASIYVTLSVNQMDSDTHDIDIQQSAEFHLFRSSEGCRYTVLDTIRHSVGGVVAGTRGGTLEFFKCSGENIPEHVSSFALSSENDRPSFISCLSSCTQAAYIACVTSFDEHQNEDKIHILQSESTCGQLDYRLEDCFVSPSGIVSQISWVQTPSPFRHLVIGYQAGQVDIFVRKRQGLWVPVGTYLSSLELTTLTTTKRGLPIVGAGRHMLFLSSDAHTFSADVLDDTAVMQMALAIGGAFQDYHHIPLLTLLQIGHLHSIDIALNEMTEFLKEWESTPEDEHLEEIFTTTINGPPSLLDQTFAESIVPPVNGLLFGDDTLFCVPFKEHEGHAFSEDMAPDAPSVLPVTNRSPAAAEDPGLLTGQFDFTRFSNFSMAPQPATTYEASGLLDMSALGMSFGMPSPQPEVPNESDIQEASNPSEENVEPSKEDNENDGDVDEEECILFTLDADFDEQCRAMLQLKEPGDLTFDQGYIRGVLEQYVNSDADQALPLSSLLKLSKNNANLLLDLINKYNAWTKDMSKAVLDIPGMKFLAAVKLSPLSMKCQPRRTESKNLTSELLKKEDYLASFLGISFYQSVISEASVATSVSDSSLVDDRLAEGYISWPESVGIVSGIEAVHILWALETDDASHLLSVCLDATAEAGSHNGKLSTGYSWEKLKSIGAGFWIRDPEAAIRVADEIAKDQFRKNNDPHDCALMYIALKKKVLLSRLFRSNGNARVATLLAKDFSQNHNRHAAAKNAYVLLGQHRYSLAAAFFLVGGYIHDAIGVCAKEMKDPQLALFLTTLLRTRDAGLVHEIIMKEVFPHAVATDDRVAQGMLLWLMDQKMEALKAITTVKALKSELSIHDRTVSKILLLQFVFWRGLMQLNRRYVPLWMFDQIKSVAAHCAHVLEACGMPSLALRALMVGRDLENQLPNPRDTSLYHAWSTRLATAMMITHLPSPHAVNARDPAMILWHQHVQQDVETLSEFGVEVDGDIVFEHMQYVMDCLYDVPSAPVFPKQASQPPDLSGPNGRFTAPSPIPAYLRMPISTTKDAEEEASVDEIASLQSSDLLHVEGDRCVGVCFSRNEGFFGVRNPTTKRVAVATGKHGIHYIDWDPVEDPQSMAAYRNIPIPPALHDPLCIRTDALYEKFEKERWPSLSWLRDTTALDHQGNAISMKEILSGPLKSHPSSSFFLSGCGEESILLWQYGMGTPCARFALESSTGTGFETMHRLSWSATGDRVAAVGYSGMCALWDVTSAHYNQAIGRTDWSYKIAPKKGYDVEFVMGSGSVIATTGEDDVGRGIVSLWDTLAPCASCRISHLEYRHAVTELTTIPDTLLFISAQDSGTIQAHDFRMLGGVAPKALWSLNSIHDGPITSLEVGWAPVASPRVWELFLATGGRDGDVCLINGIHESGQLRQRLKRAHWKKTGQLAHLFISGLRGNLGNVSLPPFGVQRTHPESASGVSVLDIDWCDEGLLTAGADGFVQLFPFSS